MNAEGIDDRFRRFPHRDAGYMERRGLVRLAHVARPFGMERISALRVGLFGFARLVSLVTRIKMAFEHEVAIRESPGIDGSRFHQPHRKSLHGSRCSQFVAAAGQDNVIESPARDQCRGGGHAEAHRQRNRLLVFVMLRDDLPHVRAGCRLKRAYIAPPRVHPVVTNVAASVKILADHDAVAAADRLLGFQRRMPYGKYPPVDVEVVGNDRFLAWRFG